MLPYLLWSFHNYEIMEIQNILVATDFSNNAYSALFYATKLLESKKCTFYILNTYSELTPLKGELLPGFGGKKVLQQLEAESKERLAQISHKIVLDNENPQHTFETISKKGELVKVINKKLEELDIDLVVMGNKGLTDTADIFFGSNTIQTVKHITKCPVLGIPGEMGFKPPKEIAFVTDFKKGCTKETIALLLYTASLSESSVRVMHITEEDVLNKAQESQRKLLELCLKGIDHSFHWVQEFSDKAMVIDSFLKEFKIDMFAMVHQKRSFFEKLVREPVIKDISMYSDIPFLILPTHD